MAFLEAVALFLRMIPLYPPGHVRVAAATERLLEVLRASPGSTVVEVSRAGLLVRGEDAGELSPGPAAFRAALLQTAVSQVTFEPDARPEAYVEFSRALQHNTRLAGHGQVTFADLWTTQIPGIRVEELRFRREGFEEGDAEASDDAVAASYAEALRSGEGLFGSAWHDHPSGSDGDEDLGADDPDDDDTTAGVGGRDGESGAAGARSPVATSVPDLRLALQCDVEIRDLLESAERALEATPSSTLGRLPVGADADFLEHLLRLLPTEARADPRKARESVRRVLERFVEGLAKEQGAPEHRPQAAVLMQALWSVFPRRRDVPREVEPPNTQPPPAAKQDPEDGDLAFLDALGAAHDDPARTVSLSSALTPELTPHDGILDLSGILTHAWLAEPVPERRDVLARRLVDALLARPAGAHPPCLLSHMQQAVAIPLPFTDLDRLARLARVAELAGLDRSPSCREWLPEDVVVAAFPRLLRAHLRTGGAAGQVLRRVGRDQVLAAGAALFDPDAGLDAHLLDTVLASHAVEAWWVIEALLSGDDAALHVKAQRSLRGRDMPSIAALAFRAAPSSMVPTSFLRGLAQDGSTGADSHRLDAEALALLRRCIEDRALPSASRVYATACLSAFGMATAEPILRDLLRRQYGLLHALPREVRRQAKVMLQDGGVTAAPPAPAPVPIVEEGT